MSESYQPEHDLNDRREYLLSNIITGDRLDSMEFPPLEWTVPGLIPEGYGLFIGSPKVGRSWTVLGIALAVAAGGIALGCMPVTRRPVLYLALEAGLSRLQARSRTLLGAGVPIPKDLHLYTQRGPEVIGEIIPCWMSQYGHLKPLVVLDTLGTVMPEKRPGRASFKGTTALVGP